MKEQQLIDIQDTLLEASKQFLLDRGFVTGVAYLVTYKGCEDGATESGQFGLMYPDLKDLVKTVRTEDQSYTILAIDMEPDDFELLGQFCHMFKDSESQEKMKTTILESLELAKSLFGLDEKLASTITLNTLLDNFQADRKDITAMMLNRLCESTKAFAVIHNTEAFSLKVDNEKDRERFNRNLRDDPDSVEVLMSAMECHDFRRIINVPIVREPPAPGQKRDSGKILSFGDPDISLTKNGTVEAGGRFMNMLEKVD